MQKFLEVFLSTVDTIIERAMPYELQSAEWGVRAIKGPFKRLTVPLSPDSYNRYRIIACTQLYTFGCGR